METLELLTANATKAQRKTLFGRDFLMARVVLITPGVLNGSQGPLYYPPEEVSKNPELWNHIPVVLNHPPNGANDPEVLNSTQVGFLLNARVEDGKLTADGWFDVARVMQVDNRILANLTKGQPIEVSTGLGVKQDPVENGNFNGKTYTAIARDFKPDHLAILVDSIGACSIKDGCGVLVNENFEPLINMMSHEQIRETISQQLRSEFKQDEPRAYVAAVFDAFFIYEQGEKLYQRSYSINDGSILIGSNPVEVRRDVEFKPVANMKGLPMAKEQLVNDLIANCDCWTEKHKDILSNMSDAEVQSFLDKAKAAKQAEAVANAAKAGYEDDNGKLTWNAEKGEWEYAEKFKLTNEPKDKTPVTNEVSKDSVKNAMKELTAEEWFEMAPPEVQETTREATEIRNAERAKLIETIVDNSEDSLKESNKRIAENMKTDALKSWVSTLPKKVTNNPFAPSYAGAAAAVSNVSEYSNAKPIPLGLPSWD